MVELSLPSSFPQDLDDSIRNQPKKQINKFQYGSKNEINGPRALKYHHSVDKHRHRGIEGAESLRQFHHAGAIQIFT